MIPKPSESDLTMDAEAGYLYAHNHPDPEKTRAWIRRAVTEAKRADRAEKAVLELFRWQAEHVNELMPTELSLEVKDILGTAKVDSVIFEVKP